MPLMNKLPEPRGSRTVVRVQCRPPSSLRSTMPWSGSYLRLKKELNVRSPLGAKGFEVDRRKLQLHEPIKKLGQYDVPLKLHLDVVTNVKVKVMAEGSGASK